jgi:hypothetical protein
LGPLADIGAVAGAIVAGAVAAVGSILAAFLTPALDEMNSPVAWGFSFFIKWLRSPNGTTLGMQAALFVRMGGERIDFRRGSLFLEVGRGNGAITLGGVVWTQSGIFDQGGDRIPDDLARHEAYHTRTVATMGEIGASTSRTSWSARSGESRRVGPGTT